jgi:hypothetical protein
MGEYARGVAVLTSIEKKVGDVPGWVRPGETVYQVREGETLYKIIQKQYPEEVSRSPEKAGEVREEIIRSNPAISNPNVIRSGQPILLPSVPKSK